jgi:hypothetical protein
MSVADRAPHPQTRCERPDSHPHQHAAHQSAPSTQTARAHHRRPRDSGNDQRAQQQEPYFVGDHAEIDDAQGRNDSRRRRGRCHPQAEQPRRPPSDRSAHHTPPIEVAVGQGWTPERRGRLLGMELPCVEPTVGRIGEPPGPGPELTLKQGQGPQDGFHLVTPPRVARRTLTLSGM